MPKIKQSNTTTYSSRALLCILCLSLFISGCSVSPTPLKEGELSQLGASDFIAATKNIPAITHALTLEEAVARALKYNMEHRVKIYENSLAANRLESGKFDMMPKVLTDAGYSWRDNSNSRDTSGSSTVSSDKAHTTGQLSFYWSLLDFGLGYYNAKENADRVLVSIENRRKVMHSLIQQVESAFWRAAAAEKLRDKVLETIETGEQALERSRRISSEQLGPPEDALRYQRNLLENLRLLGSINNELTIAQTQLASLIVAKPNAKINLQYSDVLIPKPLAASVETLEKLALINNPDLRISHYNSRMAINDTKRVFLKLLPTLGISAGTNYDSDSFLTNNFWQAAGLSVSYNLLNILSAPSKYKTSQSGVDLAVTKRMAIQLSLLAQIHLSVREYEDSLTLYSRANDIYEVDTKLAIIAKNKEQSEIASSLSRISSDVTAILSEVRRYHAIARVKEAESRIHATLGIEPQITSLDETPLPLLVSSLKTYYAAPLINRNQIATSGLFDPPAKVQPSDNQVVINKSLQQAEAPSAYNPPSNINVVKRASDRSLSYRQIASNAIKKGRFGSFVSVNDQTKYWLEAGSFGSRQSAEYAKNIISSQLGSHPVLLTDISHPIIRYFDSSFRVQFGPFTKAVLPSYSKRISKKLGLKVQHKKY